MPALVRRWTRDEVLALPEDGMRYELIDGQLLVTPSPRKVHQGAVAARTPTGAAVGLDIDLRSVFAALLD